MVAFVMIVLEVFVNDVPERAFGNEDQLIETGFLDRPHEAFRVGIEIGRTGRQADGSAPAADNVSANASVNRGSRSWRRNRFPRRQPASGSMSWRPHGPPTRCPARGRCRRSPPVASPGRSRTTPRSASAHQRSRPRPRRNSRPRARRNPAEELLPGRPSLSLRRQVDPVPFQNAGDGASAHMVIEVGERPVDPGIAPRAVLRRDPDDPLANLLGDRWPPPTTAEGYQSRRRPAPSPLPAATAPVRASVGATIWLWDTTGLADRRSVHISTWRSGCADEDRRQDSESTSIVSRLLHP